MIRRPFSFIIAFMVISLPEMSFNFTSALGKEPPISRPEFIMGVKANNAVVATVTAYNAFFIVKCFFVKF
jgi:hypothetical protein